MKDKIVPLISSKCVGPLGLVHLPRLWWKISLSAMDKLDEEYFEMEPGGLDNILISGLGLEPRKIRKYIHDRAPTYPEFEEWVKNQPEIRTDKASISRLNALILGYEHDDINRREILINCGIKDDENAPCLAVVLNDLEDWLLIHDRMLAGLT